MIEFEYLIFQIYSMDLYNIYTQVYPWHVQVMAYFSRHI